MPIPMRRCVASLFAGIVPFVSTGFVPVWVAPAGQSSAADDSDEWFPCQDHQCGCLNAEMCRTQCCCRETAIAPPPPPVTESCCDHGKVETPTSSERRGAGLAVQSASCAGRGTSWLTVIVCWILQFERDSIHLPMDPAVRDAQVTALCDQIDLSPEPPPPRAC